MHPVVKFDVLPESELNHRKPHLGRFEDNTRLKPVESLQIYSIQ